MEKYRTFTPRLLALILDVIIIVLPVVIAFVIIDAINLPSALRMILSFVLGLTSSFYFIILHAKFGQTIGKRVANVKVLDISETPIGYRQAFLRELPNLILSVASFIVTDLLEIGAVNVGSPAYFWTNPMIIIFHLWLIADLGVFLFNEKRRALHDYIAGTVVVRTYIK